MKRDWDVIREVLTEIETTPLSERTNLTVGAGGFDTLFQWF